MATEATALMLRVRTGDGRAFDDLLDRVRGRAYRMAYSLVGSREDALDLCQEAFLKVFRSRESYDPGQPFLPWFHRILRNTCFSHLRKRRRVRPLSLSGVGADGEEQDFEVVDDGPPPSAGAEDREQAELFRWAIGRLSARDQEMLVLRHYEDLSYKAIAAQLGIPEGTVMSRLYHARRRLRDVLEPLMEEAAEASEPRRRGSTKEDDR